MPNLINASTSNIVFRHAVSVKKVSVIEMMLFSMIYVRPGYI